MARVVVIGGSGHVGTYLVPALVERGHEVVNVSRGQSAPYRPTPPGPRWNRSPPTALRRMPTAASVHASSRSVRIS